MEFKKLLPILIALGLLVAGFTIAATDDVSVNVTIASLSQITVLPDSLNWTALSPGTAGGVINLTIKNTGTVDVTNIFAYVNTNETETVRPYGITNPQNWSSGNMLTLKNISAGSMYYFGQRKEWNQTSAIPNIDLTNLGAARSRVGTGFLRNTSHEFVWAAVNGTNSSQAATSFECNNSGSLFAIEDDIDTGVSATRTPTTTSIVRDGGDGVYSYYSVNRAAAPIFGSCVAVRYDCAYILVYKFDMRSGFSTCANAHYLRSAALNPGNTEDLKADAWVPNGIPTGQLHVATMTVSAT